MIFVDTNVFLRFLLKDDPREAARCRDLFRKAVEGRLKLFTTALVILEIEWVLRTVYKLAKEEIQEKVEMVLHTDGLTVENGEILRESIGLYALKNIDLVDAYHAIYISKKLGGKKLYSYDEDFDRVSFLERLRP